MAVVAFDAGPDMPQPTGVGMYVRHLGRALKDEYGGRVRIFGSRCDGGLADIADAYARVERYQVWLQTWASGEAAATGAQLAHYTNGVAPIRSSLPYVLTVHDLSLIRYPRYHPFRRLLSVPLMVAAIRRARRVLVPSTATADELRRVLRVNPRRVDVIPHAPDPDQSPLADPEARRLLDGVGLAEAQYVLSISTLEPRKNIGRLVAAFDRVDRADLHLVLLGRRGWHTDAIDRALAHSPARERIHVLGYVSDATRRALLQRAALFAYVSLYEGYGLPIIDAMAAGVPVVASNTSSMPEAAGGAAVLVDPHDVRAIARGIDEALSRRADWASAGLDRVRALSWRGTARATMAAYEEELAA